MINIFTLLKINLISKVLITSSYHKHSTHSLSLSATTKMNIENENLDQKK